MHLGQQMKQDWRGSKLSVGTCFMTPFVTLVPWNRKWRRGQGFALCLSNLMRSPGNVFSGDRIQDYWGVDGSPKCRFRSIFEYILMNFFRLAILLVALFRKCLLHFLSTLTSLPHFISTRMQENDMILVGKTPNFSLYVGKNPVLHLLCVTFTCTQLILHFWHFWS